MALRVSSLIFIHIVMYGVLLGELQAAENGSPSFFTTFGIHSNVQRKH